jgi:hypothetical protein
MAAESVHGAIRNLTLAPLLGDFRARQVSVFSGSAMILLLTWLTISWVGARSAGVLVGIGLMWMALTLAFELSLGRLLGRGWHELAADLNLLEGGLLPLGLAVLAAAPYIAGRLRRMV